MKPHVFGPVILERDYVTLRNVAFSAFSNSGVDWRLFGPWIGYVPHNLCRSPSFLPLIGKICVLFLKPRENKSFTVIKTRAKHVTRFL